MEGHCRDMRASQRLNEFRGQMSSVRVVNLPPGSAVDLNERGPVHVLVPARCQEARKVDLPKAYVRHVLQDQL